MMPLVLVYRGSSGLSREQQSRIADAKAIGRPIKLIKTCVVNG